MGASGKWLKSFIAPKKSSVDDQIGDEAKSKKKWKLWRSSSEGFGSSVKGESLKMSSVASFVADEAFAAAMATVVRAPPKDFKAVKQEWAAIRIQAVFRGVLARRALKALRAVVRIQAIFRGRQVRKQAAVTLRCMQALVRVQARMRGRCVDASSEAHVAGKSSENETNSVKQSEGGWCSSPGTLSDVQAKLHNRQRGVVKRERAMAYSVSQQFQRARSSASPYARTNRNVKPSKKPEKQGNDSSEMSWLDRWMASKPWVHDESTPETTPVSKKTGDRPYSIEVRRNNVTSKISAKPVFQNPSSPSSSSSPSTSLASPSPKMVDLRKPSYMSLTASRKAKQRYENDFLCHSSPIALSKADTRSCAGLDSSVNLSRDLYPPSRYNSVRSRRPRV